MQQTTLAIKTLQNLSECYDTHAQKFSSTRKKIRPEMERTIKHIKQLSDSMNKPIRIVELGCGDGRLIRELIKNYPDSVESYTGVDISQGLLTIARQQTEIHTKIQWIHDDMISYLSKQNNESIDLIITMASYQHLPDSITRKIFIHNVYRTLQYEGQRITVDWSRSWRMVSKYYKNIFSSIRNSIKTLGYHERNSLLILFSNQGDSQERYYHFHTLYEIKNLISHNNLQIAKRSYSSQNGDFHYNIFKARNLCIISIKSIYNIVLSTQQFENKSKNSILGYNKILTSKIKGKWQKHKKKLLITLKNFLYPFNN